jgi:virulence-associated protein VapD
MSRIKTQILHDYLHSQLAVPTDVKKVLPKAEFQSVQVEMYTREQLMYALYQAVELEHRLMMQYLFTAYSIKGLA